MLPDKQLAHIDYRGEFVEFVIDNLVAQTDAEGRRQRVCLCPVDVADRWTDIREIEAGCEMVADVQTCERNFQSLGLVQQADIE